MFQEKHQMRVGILIKSRCLNVNYILSIYDDYGNYDILSSWG